MNRCGVVGKLKWIPFEIQNFSKYRPTSNPDHKTQGQTARVLPCGGYPEPKFLVSFGIYISGHGPSPPTLHHHATFNPTDAIALLHSPSGADAERSPSLNTIYTRSGYGNYWKWGKQQGAFSPLPTVTTAFTTIFSASPNSKNPVTRETPILL